MMLSMGMRASVLHLAKYLIYALSGLLAGKAVTIFEYKRAAVESMFGTTGACSPAGVFKCQNSMIVSSLGGHLKNPAEGCDASIGVIKRDIALDVD